MARFDWICSFKTQPPRSPFPEGEGGSHNLLECTHPSPFRGRGWGRGLLALLLLPSALFAQTLQIAGKIAFKSHRDGNDEVYVMNTDGTNQVRLTNNSEIDDVPSWSPDWTKIVFHSRRDGNYQIYMMNADGTNQTRLSNNSFNDGLPSWSPDGSKILNLIS